MFEKLLMADRFDPVAGSLVRTGRRKPCLCAGARTARLQEV